MPQCYQKPRANKSNLTPFWGLTPFRGQGVDQLAGIGAVAGGEEQQPRRVRGEGQGKLLGGGRAFLPIIIFQGQGRRVQPAVAGHVQHIGAGGRSLAGEKRLQQRQRTAFLNDQVQARIGGGPENGRLLGLVAEVLLPGWGGCHENDG